MALTFDKITEVKGSTPHLAFSFTWDEDGSPARDITGSVVKFRALKEDNTQLFERTATITSAAGGLVQVDLLAADTATVGVYYAELELRLVGGGVGGADDVQLWRGTFAVEGPT